MPLSTLTVMLAATPMVRCHLHYPAHLCLEARREVRIGP
jgi:hypothetical protein